MSAAMKVNANSDLLTSSTEVNGKILKTKIYKKRYFILVLYCFLTFCSHIQFLQFTTILNVVRKFFDVSTLAVNFTGTIWFIVYIPGSLIATVSFGKLGLRNIILCGASFNVIALILKCLSVDSDRFWLIMCGQTIAGISEVFILSIPPHLSEVWFPSHQVSKATGIGYAFTLLGVAAGMLLPSRFIPYTDIIDDLRSGFLTLFFTQLTLNTISFILILKWFSNKPNYPPSTEQAIAELQNDENDNICFTDIIGKLFKNRNFLVILVSFGIMKGVGESVSVNLSDMVVQQIPDAHEFPGIIGLSFSLCGIPGSIVFGLLLDACHNYRHNYCLKLLMLLTPLLLYITFFTSFIFAVFTQHIALIYLCACSLGFVDGSLPVISYEIGGEVTYPLPQSITATFQVCFSQIFSILFSVIGSFILSQFGLIEANMFILAFMLFAVFFTFLFKQTLS